MDEHQVPSMNTPKGVRYQCICCGYFTLEEVDAYEGCPVCFWEDDPVQNADPSYSGGANHPSLDEARHNFQAFGATERRFVQYVRQPLPEEMPPDPNIVES